MVLLLAGTLIPAGIAIIYAIRHKL
jgi:hypothetical protein